MISYSNHIIKLYNDDSQNYYNTDIINNDAYQNVFIEEYVDKTSFYKVEDFEKKTNPFFKY